MIRYQAISCAMLLAGLLCSCSKQSSSNTSPSPAAAEAVQPKPTGPAVLESAPAAPSAAPAAPDTVFAAAPPASASVLKSGETNSSGVIAEVIQCDRKDGVLSMRVHFRNVSAKKTYFTIINGRNYEKYYLTAGSKKYFILKDSEGTYLTPLADGAGGLGVDLDPGGQYTWWAKFPAPPPEAKEVTLYMPVAPPLEDIPVSGR
jgi:hypothetical protein